MLLAAGAIAGAATGMYLARRFGSLFGFARDVRQMMRGLGEFWTADDELEEDEEDFGSTYGSGDEDDDLEDDFESEESEEAGSTRHAATEGRVRRDPPARRAERALEARVLRAFENDRALGRRAIEIGAAGPAVIELSGWVHSPDEAVRAASVARQVDGVETVVDRLTVRAPVGS